MSELDTVPVRSREEAQHTSSRDPFRSRHHRPSAISDDPRIAELEIENSRLHRLVAELLIKNQQLRQAD